MYTEYSPTRTLAGVGVGFTDWSLPEPPADRYTDELMNNAKAFSDTAVIVLARSGGEGQDLPAEMGPGIGRTAMNALGKILKGTVNPSGRTVETYIYDQKATPAYNNYGSFTYDNVDALLEQYTAFDPGFQGALSFVNYVEGIYVGYRFYETACAEAQAGHMTFDYDSVAGKEVVEVYFTPPYNNGGIEKAAVNLVNFAKTDVLAPGASQTIPFTIPKEDMASYDSSAIKTANGGYIRPLQSRRPRRGRGCDARHRGQKRPEAGGHDGQAL